MGSAPPAWFRRPELIAALFVALALLFKGALMYLTAFSGIAVPADSSYLLNLCTNYFNHGEWTYRLWRIPLGSPAGTGAGSGYGVGVLLAWTRLFGVSLWSGQVLMYLAGALSLPFCFSLAREWWKSSSAGAAGAAFIALSSWFVAQFFIRMDAMAVWWSCFALWAWVKAGTRPGGLILCGVVFGLGLEVHVLASVWLGAVGFASLWPFVVAAVKRRSVRVPEARGLLFLVGAVPVTVAFAAIHILPNPHSYFLISQFTKAESHWGLVQELARLMRVVTTSPLESAVVSMGVAVALVRRTEADVRFLTLGAGFALTLAVVNPPVSVEYLAHGMAFFALAAARLWDAATEWPSRGAAAVAVAATMSVNLGTQVRTTMKQPKEDTTAVDFIRAHVPTDAVVMGKVGSFHRLMAFDNYLAFTNSWDSLVPAAYLGVPYREFLERERPAVILGGLKSGQPEVADYAVEHGFREARPDLWIEPGLLERIAAKNPPPEVDVELTPERVSAGECATLRWVTGNVESVVIDGAQVATKGELKLCPRGTRTYRVSLRHAGGMTELSRELRVE